MSLALPLIVVPAINKKQMNNLLVNSLGFITLVSLSAEETEMVWVDGSTLADIFVV